MKFNSLFFAPFPFVDAMLEVSHSEIDTGEGMEVIVDETTP